MRLNLASFPGIVQKNAFAAWWPVSAVETGGEADVTGW